MTFSLSIRAGAARDIADAHAWYEAENEGLGSEFLDALQLVFSRVVGAPERFPIVRADVRRALLRRFPYSVYFRVVGCELRVLAVVHQSRNPVGWQRRIRR